MTYHKHPRRCPNCKKTVETRNLRNWIAIDAGKVRIVRGCFLCWSEYKRKREKPPNDEELIGEDG